VEWIEALQGSTVGLDTAPLIYFIERHPVYAAKLRPFFTAAERGEFTLVTSMVTLLEVLVHPLRHGRDDLVHEYRTILMRSASVTAVPVEQEIALEAARLRAAHNVRTPDSIQLATATTRGATWFLTNDNGLPRLPRLSMLLLHELPSPRFGVEK
jgi:predicted nucleic acid-binding protein